MQDLRSRITAELGQLKGLRLSISRRAADLRGFHFGVVRPIPSGTAGEFALHVQCAWRIESSEKIITGRSDLWEPVHEDAEIDWENWNYDIDANLQDHAVQELLGGYDSETKSAINETDHLIVTEVESNAQGGFTLSLSGGYRLVVFPAGARGENWRLFRPEEDTAHFVVEGGKVEEY